MHADVELLAGREVWERLHRLGGRARRGRVWAAISFVTEDLIGLKKGDVLVVNLDRSTLRSGATNPAALRKMHGRGVEIFEFPGLHAKAVVLGGSAIVGSANMSAASRDSWFEAAAVMRGREAAQDVRRMVQDLAGAMPRVNLARLDEAAGEYRSPRWGSVHHPERDHLFTPPRVADRMWVLPLESVAWPDHAHDAYRRSIGTAKGAAGPPRLVDLDTFLWGGSLDQTPVVGDVVLQAWEADGETWIWPPSRVVHREPSSGKAAVYHIVTQKGLEPKPIDEVDTAARSHRARVLGHETMIRPVNARGAILSLWW